MVGSLESAIYLAKLFVMLDSTDKFNFSGQGRKFEHTDGTSDLRPTIDHEKTAPRYSDLDVGGTFNSSNERVY